jgi:thioredoxin reductase (NADPH)
VAVSSPRIPTGAAFVMVSAARCSAWLQGTVELDDQWFVLTGRDVAGDGPTPVRSPSQTGQPGVFAVGDVRSGTVKRVAAAAGEGSVVVQAVHRYPAKMRSAEP